MSSSFHPDSISALTSGSTRSSSFKHLSSLTSSLTMSLAVRISLLSSIFEANLGGRLVHGRPQPRQADPSL